jgi:methylmalonyl-CoA mutase N-terminal domain/subunit
MTGPDEAATGRKAWEEKHAGSSLRDADFSSLSGRALEPLYTREDLAGLADTDGLPGEYPFTRGVHASMYRGKLWTMRQFAGMGTAAQTNERYRFLLEKGQTGLSVAFDNPTLYGLDSDHALSEGEVGKTGVAVDTLADMERLFHEIPLERVSTSMTINAPAAWIFAMFLANARDRGIPFGQLRGTLQNDILKEYIAQKEWIFPPEPHLRLITDLMSFCADHVPQWNTISVSGYHIREAGATAAQELAFTLADGFAYVEHALAAGQKIDDFAPRLSFFFNSHLDFFEEIAKLRAARRIWARHMRETYQAKDPRSWLCRIHVQTAGCSLTAQQPGINVVRTAIEGRRDRPAHPADPRLRERRGERDRPAGRLVLRRETDQRPRGRGRGVLPPDPRAGWSGEGHRAGLLPAGDHPLRLRVPGCAVAQAQDPRRRE